LKSLKYIFLFIVILSLSKKKQCYAQTFADKSYYLVDSLVLDELSTAEKQLIDSSLNVYHKAKTDTSKINAIETIIEGSWDESIWPKYNNWLYNFIQKKINQNPSKKTDTLLLSALSASLNNLGFVEYKKGNIDEALNYYKQSLKIDKDLNNEEGISTSLNNIGSIYQIQGNIPKALNYYHDALKIRELKGDKNSIAQSFNNIASIYDDQGQIEKALEYYNKSLKIHTLLNDKYSIALLLNNIGYNYEKLKNIPKAIDYHNNALEIRKEINDKNGIAQSLNNIGAIYKNQGNTDKALAFFYESLHILESLKDNKNAAHLLNNIGELLLKSGKTKSAEGYISRSLKISQEIGVVSNIKTSAYLLSSIYEQQGKGIEALKMYKLSITMRDSIKNEASQKATAQQQAKYEYEKQKALDDAENEKLIAIEKEKKVKQQIITYATGGGLGLVMIFLIFVFNRLRITKKQKLVIEEQKQEVEQQKEVVEMAHAELEEKNQEIMDSITYAKRIQSAILPPAKVVKEYLQESFILYKPKDIVAGDFYWMEQRDGKVLFAAADCTGHGVPGAMVSVVCNNALNRSVREHGLTNPGEILNKTREIVIQEFEKSDEEVKDGMDIALCSIEGNILKYAGAHNPLWIIRKGEIFETKANKQPIGKFDNPLPYTTHSFELQKGDSIYIFSDGYVDQFGGEKGKKFKAKAFRELLLSIQDKSMEKQKIIINKAFESWRGNLEQIDDVCVIGVKFT
jgi:serine phosphatase RsbU (regulator of sigma subunit)